MDDAYKIASQTAQEERRRAKSYYDRKVYGGELEPGQRVLVKNSTERGGPGKLRSYWEDQVYVVTGRKHPGSPVYDVKPEKGVGRSRVLHRNVLLPCDFLPMEESDREAKETQKRKETTQGRLAKKGRARDQTDSMTSYDENSSEDEEKWRIITSAPEKQKHPHVQLRLDAKEFHPYLENKKQEL